MAKKIFTASVRDYFDTDNARSRGPRDGLLMTTNFDFPVTIHRKDTDKSWSVLLYQRLFFDYEANSIYSYLYIPSLDYEIDIVHMCKTLTEAFASDPLYGAPPAIRNNSINFRKNAVDRFHMSHNLVDSRQLVFYIDATLSEEQKDEVYRLGNEQRMYIKIRDSEYAAIKSQEERPLAFISHDSRDKDAIARPLAESLTRAIGRVWFDEYSLKIGDPLRESIEQGIKRCEKCILILTPNFLSNPGWTRAEFNSIFTRELIEKNNVILPVWSDVSVNDVYEYSPSLADRVAANWTEGVDSVTEKIQSVL